MDVSLSEGQRAWQLKARQFAQEIIAPVSVERDRIARRRRAFDWDVIKKGSKLGFRTAIVPKEWGGHGIDFVTQAVVMAELARGDMPIAKTFSQCWKWSHLIMAQCNDEQKERFLRPSSPTTRFFSDRRAPNRTRDRTIGCRPKRIRAPAGGSKPSARATNGS